MNIFKRIKKLEEEMNKLYFKSIVIKSETNGLRFINGVKVKFENNSPNPDPSYAFEGDSGFDLRAWISDAEDGVIKGDDGTNAIVLQPHERRLIHTGIKAEIPYHTEIQVRPRSGNALKKGLSVANCVGTIDEGYRNEIGVIALNTSNEMIEIKNGDRIAQAVVCPVINSRFVTLEKVQKIGTETDRGEGGFGHTGNN